MFNTSNESENFAQALIDLAELDYSAIEAYEEAIKHLKNPDYQEKLSQYKEDHVRHTEEISRLLKAHGKVPPDGSSLAKNILTKGKVVFAELVGDQLILSAMRSNEVDTNNAYEKINAREDIWADSLEILKRGLSDERKHKAWLDSVIE